jgi:membrane-bound metal-dependent hydrolase YbcI (DUF457 family)
MLGRDHALSGALVLAALAPLLHVSGETLPAGIVLAAGAGVLPDIDHPDSTIARSFGVLTEGFAKLVATISGGHRHGTHSLVGIAVFTAGAWAAGAYQIAGKGGVAFSSGSLHGSLGWHMLPAALYLTLLYSSALRALHIGGHHGDLIGFVSAAVTCYLGADVAYVAIGHWQVPLLAVATGLGCAAHIAGDELTHGGCPVLWPVSKHEFHLLPKPFQITTAKLCETWVVFPLLVIGLAAAIWHATGHPLWVTPTPAGR